MMFKARKAELRDRAFAREIVLMNYDLRREMFKHLRETQPGRVRNVARLVQRFQ